MAFHAWQKLVKRLAEHWTSAPRSPGRRARSHYFKPGIERLEHRLVLSSVSLTSDPTLDCGCGSSAPAPAVVRSPSASSLSSTQFSSTTSILVTAGPSADQVTLTASVSGFDPDTTNDVYPQPGETVAFYLDYGLASEQLLGYGMLDSVGNTAPLVVSLGVEGTHTIKAVYGGNDYLTASESGNVTVDIVCPSGLGILLLNQTGRALQVDGNGLIDLQEGQLVVNSGDSRAAFISSNGVVKAGSVDIHGGAFLPGHGLIDSPDIEYGAATVADPLAALAVPAMGTLRSSKTLTINSGNVTLLPGLYKGGINITGTANVTLMPGVYYMDGGGFSISGQANVTDNGAGVMIYNAAKKNSDTISIVGQGIVRLTGLTDGSAYQGLVFFQDRNSKNTIQLDGQGIIDLTGSIYGAKALVKVNGNGDKVLRSDMARHISAQIIAGEMMVTGNGKIRVEAGHGGCTVSVRGTGQG